jgi:hypothetical protein
MLRTLMRKSLLFSIIFFICFFCISIDIITSVDITCSGSSSHYCSTTYKSIDSVNSITVPSSVSCGNAISVILDWTGRHNFNDNHWGFFLESISYSYLYYLGSCKSYVADSSTNSYKMSCSVKIPTTSGITNGNYYLWVTGEDYNGYCYPGEVGLDAQNYKTITLNNCQIDL